MKTGLVPHLITSLTRHAVLAQETADTNVKESAVSHLARCRTEMQRFTELVKDGQLPEATVVCEELEKLLVHPPRPLEDAALLGDLKVSFIVWVKCTDLIHCIARISRLERPYRRTTERRVFSKHSGEWF